MAWDKALQPIFDAKCVSCHGGTQHRRRSPPYTITDPVTGTSISWTFNLRAARCRPSSPSSVATRAFTGSYFSMAGPDMEAIEEGDLVIAGNFKVYLNPRGRARNSLAIQMLNPRSSSRPRTRASRVRHDAATCSGKGADLTADEFYALILAADIGVNFFARENNPGLNRY